KTDLGLQQALIAAFNTKALRSEALAIVSEAGLAQFIENLAVILAPGDAAGSKAEKLAAIAAIARNNFEPLAPHIAGELLTTKDADVRDAAARALVSLRDAKLLTALVAGQEL